MNLLKLGFAKHDITPRIGVELCGFGPFLNRHSKDIRDRLWARAMALENGTERIVIITCDLVGISPDTTRRVRDLLHGQEGLAPSQVMICCSHTHSGPAPGVYVGWGDPDWPYLEVLPRRIAAAASAALRHLEPASLNHAEVPCEGIGLNREFDKDAPPLEDVLADDWRPAKPELTDTTCHVLSAIARNGNRLMGFVSYFGCHPVVCCQQTNLIHGDYAGVATNGVEREFDGVTGLFLQGAQGDVNSCVVHKPETDSMLALDIIASRYARSIREGIRQAAPLSVTEVSTCRRHVTFTRKPWTADEMRKRLHDCEAILSATAADGTIPSDSSHDVRMNMVYAIALRGLLARAGRGESLSPAIELHGIRIGPLALLGSPFETFQAIKRDVLASVSSPVTLVISFVNDSTGYAVDETCAARGGYAVDMVPLICGELPFAGIHRELVRELIDLEAELVRNRTP